MRFDPVFAKLIGRRLLAVPLSLVVVATFAFALVALIPGDPAVHILGQFASEDELARLRHELGLSQPLLERYLTFMSDLSRGDLGTSFFSRRPVLEEIGTYLPATVELVLLSTIGAVIIGLVTGGVGAYFRGRWPDRASSGAITLFQSVPDFLLALLLIFFLFYVLRLVPPPVGRLGFGWRCTRSGDRNVAGGFPDSRRLLNLLARSQRIGHAGACSVDRLLRLYRQGQQDDDRRCAKLGSDPLRPRLRAE